MFQKMLTGALGAGVAAWLLAAVLHFAFVQPYILLGEQYESGAVVHFGDDTHDHDTEPVAAEATGDAVAPDAEAGHDHGEHSHGGAGSELTRNFWTVVFFGLVYVGYAMVLVAGFGLATAYGRTIDARDGMLWGIAGFVTFQLAPAMGLAPELPGTVAADLAERQVWWWGTVVATGLGLATLAYGRGFVAGLVGAFLLASPHVFGAPMIDGFYGVAPPEVGAAFSARVLGVALAVWAVMGLVAGHIWSRDNHRT